MTADRFARGDSKSPYRGRGGLSGVILRSDSDADRDIMVKFVASMANSMSQPDCGIQSGDLAVVYDAAAGSLMLRSCLRGVTGVSKGKFVIRSPNPVRSGDGG